MSRSLHLVLLCCPLLCLTVGTYQLTCPIVAPCQCSWNTIAGAGAGTPSSSSSNRHSIECSGKNLYEEPKILANIEATVYKANLSNNNLQVFPSVVVTAIGDSLEILDVSGNDITGLGNIPSLPSLTHLILSDNMIQLKGSVFKNMTRLKNLNLDRNPLEQLHETCFLGLKRLTRLSLAHCSVTSIHKNAFQDLAALETLTLNSNYIVTLQAGTLSPLSRLSKLYLDDNKIKSLHYDMFGDVPLSRIELGENKIVSVDNDTFTGVRETLQTLLLDRNYLKTLPTEAFDNLYQLQHFNVWRNAIRVIPNDFLINSTELNILDLGFNKIHSNSIPEHYFQNFPHLELLYLESNSIETIPDISGLRQLRALSLLNTGITTLWPCQFKDQLSSEMDLNLWLSGTPLHCDCQLLWLHRWLKNDLRHEIDTSTKIKGWACETPRRLKGKYFHALAEEDLVCPGGKQPEYCPMDHQAKPVFSLLIRNHTTISITISWRIALRNSAEVFSAIEVTWTEEAGAVQDDAAKKQAVNITSITEPDFTIHQLTPGAAYTICIRVLAVAQQVSMDAGSDCMRNVRTKLVNVASKPWPLQQTHNKLDSKWMTIPVTCLVAITACSIAALAVYLLKRHRRARLRGQRHGGTNMADLRGIPNPMFEVNNEEEDHTNVTSQQTDMQPGAFDVPFKENICNVEVEDTTI